MVAPCRCAVAEVPAVLGDRPVKVGRGAGVETAAQAVTVDRERRHWRHVGWRRGRNRGELHGHGAGPVHRDLADTAARAVPGPPTNADDGSGVAVRVTGAGVKARLAGVAAADPGRVRRHRTGAGPHLRDGEEVTLGNAVPLRRRAVRPVRVGLIEVPVIDRRGKSLPEEHDFGAGLVPREVVGPIITRTTMGSSAGR